MYTHVWALKVYYNRINSINDTCDSIIDVYLDMVTVPHKKV